jgi:hypothetical protein
MEWRKSENAICQRADLGSGRSVAIYSTETGVHRVLIGVEISAQNRDDAVMEAERMVMALWRGVER